MDDTPKLYEVKVGRFGTLYVPGADVEALVITLLCDGWTTYVNDREVQLWDNGASQYPVFRDTQEPIIER